MFVMSTDVTPVTPHPSWSAHDHLTTRSRSFIPFIANTHQRHFLPHRHHSADAGTWASTRPISPSPPGRWHRPVPIPLSTVPCQPNPRSLVPSLRASTTPNFISISFYLFQPKCPHRTQWSTSGPRYLFQGRPPPPPPRQSARWPLHHPQRRRPVLRQSQYQPAWHLRTVPPICPQPQTAAVTAEAVVATPTHGRQTRTQTPRNHRPGPNDSLPCARSMSGLQLLPHRRLYPRASH